MWEQSKMLSHQVQSLYCMIKKERECDFREFGLFYVYLKQIISDYPAEESRYMAVDKIIWHYICDSGFNIRAPVL